MFSFQSLLCTPPKKTRHASRIPVLLVLLLIALSPLPVMATTYTVDWTVGDTLWPTDHLLVGGEIVVHGSSVKMSKEDAHAYFVFQKLNAKDKTTHIKFSAPQKSGPPVTKEFELSGLKTWLTVESDAPVYIEGELYLMSVTDLHEQLTLAEQRARYRKIKLTPENFVLTKVQERDVK